MFLQKFWWFFPFYKIFIRWNFAVYIGFDIWKFIRLPKLDNSVNFLFRCCIQTFNNALHNLISFYLTNRFCIFMVMWCGSVLHVCVINARSISIWWERVAPRHKHEWLVLFFGISSCQNGEFCELLLRYHVVINNRRYFTLMQPMDVDDVQKNKQ